MIVGEKWRAPTELAARAAFGLINRDQYGGRHISQRASIFNFHILSKKTEL